MRASEFASIGRGCVGGRGGRVVMSQGRGCASQKFVSPIASLCGACPVSVSPMLQLGALAGSGLVLRT